jgi:K+-transporting ATPase KdpC subunit
MRKDIITAALAVAVLTVVLGIAYPLAMTGIARVAFPNKSDGSLIEQDGKIVGSKLLAQPFKGDRYFHPRPSQTGYDPAATAFSNRGPNQASARAFYNKQLGAYVALERRYTPGLTPTRVPVDAVTTSASGVDPHISQANARIQANRVARARGLPLFRRARRTRRQRDRGQPRPRSDPMTERKGSSLLTAELLRPALWASVVKLDPRVQIRNPVMFVVEIGAVITTFAWLKQLFGGTPLGGGDEPAWFTFTVALWLWLTVVFANLAEALAEGRGKAQADALRTTRTTTTAHLADGTEKPAAELHRGDVVIAEAGEVIPGDGTVIEGIASVDESAITGESAPVIRESGGDRSAVTGGTRVLSDRIVVEITQDPGQSFLDRMIALVEGAARRKTPNEIALNILLAGLTLIFVVVVATARCSARSASPAWTASCGATCSPSQGAPSRRRATSTCCCSTRPARSPWATGRRPRSSRCPASARASSPRPPRWPPWPTRRPKAARSSCSPSSTASASTSSPRTTPSSSPSPRRPG